MDINQAYDFVLEKVAELERKNIKSRINYHDYDKEQLKTYEPYSLSGDKWCTISFPIEFFNEVSKIESDLYDMGITFDKGAGFGERDWEIDFSLSVNP